MVHIIWWEGEVGWLYGSYGGTTSFSFLFLYLSVLPLTWLIRILPILLSSLFLYPSSTLVSLTFQCNPRCLQKEKKKKKKCTADESKMHRSIQCSANTHSLLRQLSLCKNRTCARKVELCTVDTETKQHAGSDDVNVNQSHRSPWLTLVPPCCTQWQAFPPASLASLLGAKCVTSGAPNLWTLTLSQTSPWAAAFRLILQADTDRVKSAFPNKTWRALHSSICQQ